MPPVRLSRTPAVLHSAAPTLGQHNEDVYMGLLGRSEEEFDLLIAQDVIQIFPVIAEPD